MQEPSFVDVILTQYRLGNSLFFFDPLLSESWQRIEAIAKERIKHYYDTGTEFLIFLFSSDFFWVEVNLLHFQITVMSFCGLVHNWKL